MRFSRRRCRQHGDTRFISAAQQEVHTRRVSTIVSIVVLVSQMAAAQKKTPIADSWIGAWNSHDPEKVIAIFTPDVLFEDVTFGVSNYGSAELRKFTASIFDAVPDAKLRWPRDDCEERPATAELDRDSWTHVGSSAIPFVPRCQNLA